MAEKQTQDHTETQAFPENAPDVPEPERASFKDRLTAIPAKIGNFVMDKVLRMGRKAEVLITEAERFASFALGSAEAKRPVVFADIPTFASQLAEARAGQRNNTVLVEPTFVNAAGNEYRRSERQVTEGELLIDLDENMTTLRHEFEAHGDHETASELEVQQAGASFVGEKELTRVAEGYAAYWKSILKDNPNAKIALCSSMLVMQNEVKSGEFVASAILDRFEKMTIDEPELRDRIVDLQYLIDHAPEQIDDDTKLIITDDTVATGYQLRNIAATVHNRLAAIGLAPRDKAIEANLVALRQDQLKEFYTYYNRDNRNHPHTYQIRAIAFFATPPLSSKIVASEFYSSVDYYFGEMFRAKAVSLAGKTKREVQMPLAATIVKPYASISLHPAVR